MTLQIAPYVIKLLLALVCILVGSVFGRAYERKKIADEKAVWLTHDVPCDGFDDGDGSHQNVIPIWQNPFCITCGFRFSSHDAEVRKIHERRFRLAQAAKTASAAPEHELPIGNTGAITVPLMPNHKVST